MADARVTQEHAQPRQAAQSTAKRKRAQESAALSDADPGASVAAAMANSTSPEQTSADVVHKTEGNANAAPADPDPEVAVRKAKLSLVEDDVEWNGEAARE